MKDRIHRETFDEREGVQEALTQEEREVYDNYSWWKAWLVQEKQSGRQKSNSTPGLEVTEKTVVAWFER